MKPREITKSIEGSRVLCRVLLSDYKNVAEIWAEDLEALQALGLSTNWAALKSGHVTCNARRAASAKALVARILMDARAGEMVTYRDGNPLNLRRENLTVVPHQRARMRARDLISKEPGIVLCR